MVQNAPIPYHVFRRKSAVFNLPEFCIMKFMRQSSKINWINTIVVLALRNMYEIDDSLEIIKGDTIKRHLPTSSGTDSILRRHAIKKWHTRRLIRSSRGLPMILHAEPHTREPRAREGVIYLNLANM